ncbi:hypothetical protein JKP31_22850 [Vibrio vulnificus]|uniref:hypothetical protein n=1 Tax=Vibrio vulnificus TaxID=672 RepID=UPI001A352663|nr:hypothetical protein [Vibrio vulnificus]MCA3904082.1 hypothetical protein [Vibrio vulnificus]HAS6172652.1 hypothetical protein [Vibrio vulnificus]HAS6307149.1 hypothetical protein [Vibrio vulnificus]HDY7579087.1 hypothetical protein [Vibrio vulnificus]
MVIRKKDLVVDSVFSIQVPEYGYVLAQFRKDHHLEVFDCLRKEDTWEGVDLNNVPVLFNIVVAGHRLLKLFSKEVSESVSNNKRPQPILSLTLGEVRPSTKVFSLMLVKHEEIYDSNNEMVLIPNLDPEEHRDILYSFEYLGMNGKPEVIRSRISTYYETGINWDNQKSILYPELPLPPKGYQRMTCEEFLLSHK